MMPADRKDRIETLEYLIQGNKNQIRCTQTDLSMPERVTSAIAALDKQIEIAQRDRQRLIDSLLHGPVLIEELEKRNDELRQELITLKNMDKLAKLAELAALLNNQE